MAGPIKISSPRSDLSLAVMRAIAKGRILCPVTSAEKIYFIFVQLNNLRPLSPKSMMRSVAKGPQVRLHTCANGDLFRVCYFYRSWLFHRKFFIPDHVWVSSALFSINCSTWGIKMVKQVPRPSSLSKPI